MSRNREKLNPRRAAVRRSPVLCEALEPRCLMSVTVTPLVQSATEGKALTADIAIITDSDTTVLATDLNNSIAWGDGSAPSSGTITATATAGQFSLRATHTFPEEGGTGSSPPPVVNAITVNDTKNSTMGTANQSTTVVDAPLSGGNPITAGTPVSFNGVGTTIAKAQLQAFETAIGGVDNGGTASPQSGGFRSINWDGVKLDGTDFGGGANTTVINQGTTVGIPLNRFVTRGVYFNAVYAVSGDGFKTVNPAVNGLFPAFSTPNTFAMFNDNGIDFEFTTPTASGNVTSPAATRGFGAIFLNVELPNTSSIEYFDGNTSLGKFFVQPGTQGQPEFLGELFSQPIVTGVTLTLGTDAIFNFNGTTFTASGVADNPGASHNLVATDDFAYAEPVPIANGLPIQSGAQGTAGATVTVNATAGVPFTGTVGTFSDANRNANAKDFTATINWGDGHYANGKIQANGSGGFDVIGTNTFARSGAFAISVDVADFGGESTTVTTTGQVARATPQVALVVPTSTVVGQPTVLTATIQPPTGGTGTPAGSVSFFDGTTLLGTSVVDSTGKATLSLPLSPGAHSLTATYNGDNAFTSATSAAATTNVSPNVTSLFAIELVGNRSFRGRRARVYRLTYRGSNPLPLPVIVALDNLNPRIGVRNADGVTKNFAPLGSPFVIADTTGATQINPGDTAFVGFILSRFNARRDQLNFRVLAGVSKP
jgi:hypothetical protein